MSDVDLSRELTDLVAGVEPRLTVVAVRERARRIRWRRRAGGAVLAATAVLGLATLARYDGRADSVTPALTPPVCSDPPSDWSFDSDASLPTADHPMVAGSPRGGLVCRYATLPDRRFGLASQHTLSQAQADAFAVALNDPESAQNPGLWRCPYLPERQSEDRLWLTYDDGTSRQVLIPHQPCGAVRADDTLRDLSQALRFLLDNLDEPTPQVPTFTPSPRAS